MGMLFRPDGGMVTLADHEALWEVLTALAAERGIQYTGRLVPVDFDNLSPEKIEVLFRLKLSENDPL